jgi:predicted phage-related endonuclease
LTLEVEDTINAGVNMVFPCNEVKKTAWEVLQNFDHALVLREDDPPDMYGVKPDLALAALARIYGASKEGLPTGEFGAPQAEGIRRIAGLQREIKSLQDQQAEKEKEVDAHSVQLAEIMKTHEHGVFEEPGWRFEVDYVTRVTRRADSKALKANYPDVYAAVLKPSESRKIKIREVPA